MDPISVFLTKVASTVAIKKALDPVLSATSGILNRANIKVDIERAQESLHSVRYVKTILHSDTNVSLSEFYCHTWVTLNHLDRRPSVPVRRITDLDHHGNVVIRGLAGQGKSTFLRYLTNAELSRAASFPVFVELRHLSADLTFESLIEKTLQAQGITAAYSDFVKLASSCPFTLFLDAFDEIPETHQGAAVSAIESLIDQTSRQYVRVIISSRPEAGIVHSSHFVNLDIPPLSPKAATSIIKKVMSSSDDAAVLIQGIQDSHVVSGMLNTPLMVALLVVHYQCERTIPQTEIGFYDGLFMLLLRRHDQAKAGFARERKSGLGDSELFEIFCRFCLLTIRENRLTFSEVDLHRSLRAAIDSGRAAASAADVANDISLVTCLIVREGQTLSFIHRTVQEYHAAKAISNESEGFREKFYGNMVARAGSIENYSTLMAFLRRVDTYMYRKHFAKNIASYILKQYDEVGGLLVGLQVTRISGTLSSMTLTDLFMILDRFLAIEGRPIDITALGVAIVNVKGAEFQAKPEWDIMTVSKDVPLPPSVMDIQTELIGKIRLTLLECTRLITEHDARAELLLW